MQTVGHAGELIDRLDQFGIPTMSLVPQPSLLIDLRELRMAGSHRPLNRPVGRLEDRLHGLAEGVHGVARSPADRGLPEERGHVGDKLDKAGSADD